MAEDPEYQVLADRWRGRLLETIPFLPSRGEAAVPFDALVTIRNEEQLGNFVVDQMRIAFSEPQPTLPLSTTARWGSTITSPAISPLKISRARSAFPPSCAIST